MKNVLILGASGNIAQLVAQSLSTKANLTLYLRNPNKLNSPDVNSKIIVGDIFDKDTLVKAMKNQDIIFSNLGWQHMADMATTVVEAANIAGVSRLIWMATAGIYNEISASNSEKYVQMYGTPDNPDTYFGDERLGADIVEESNLVTTVIRPHTLTDLDIIEPTLITGRNDLVGGYPISRKTVAQFISELIQSPDHYRNESIGISRAN